MIKNEFKQKNCRNKCGIVVWSLLLRALYLFIAGAGHVRWPDVNDQIMHSGELLGANGRMVISMLTAFSALPIRRGA